MQRKRGLGVETLEARRVLTANVAAPPAAPLVEHVEIQGTGNTGGGDIELVSVGDFDNDGQLTAIDIDMLCVVSHSEVAPPKFDLTGDGLVDSADMDMLVLDLIGTRYGDTDLDGFVSTADAARMFANMFQTGTGWASGDFTCDGATDGADFIEWLKSFNETDRLVAATDPSASTTAQAGDDDAGTEVVVAAPVSSAVSLNDREGDDEETGNVADQPLIQPESPTPGNSI